MRKTLVAVLVISAVFLLTTKIVNYNDNRVVETVDYQPPPINTSRILTDLYDLPEHQSRILGMVIDDAALVEEVPSEYLIAIIKVESDFQWHAKSTEGAVGLAQIKPEYWDQVNGYNVYDRYENVYLSAYILREYYYVTKDWKKAIKAYNVGITNFNRQRQVSASQRYLIKIEKQLVRITQYKEQQQIKLVKL